MGMSGKAPIGTWKWRSGVEPLEKFINAPYDETPFLISKYSFLRRGLVVYFMTSYANRKVGATVSSAFLDEGFYM